MATADDINTQRMFNSISRKYRLGFLYRCGTKPWQTVCANAFGRILIPIGHLQHVERKRRSHHTRNFRFTCAESVGNRNLIQINNFTTIIFKLLICPTGLLLLLFYICNELFHNK